MREICFSIKLKIRSPFLLGGAKSFDWANDISVARIKNRRDGTPYIARETVKGLMRHAVEGWFGKPECDEVEIEESSGQTVAFTRQEKDSWFGAEGYNNRSLLIVEDFLLEAPEESCSAITRSAIDKNTGAPLENATFTFEQTHKRGEVAEFSGKIRLIFDETPLEKIETILKTILECIPSIGVGKAVGWGEVVNWQFVGDPSTSDFSPTEIDPVDETKPRLRLTIMPNDPFLVFPDTNWRPHSRQNILIGKDYIPGHVIFGAIAEMVERSGDQPLKNLLQNLTILHAFPQRDNRDATILKPVSWNTRFSREDLDIAVRRDDARGTDTTNGDGFKISDLPSRVSRNHTAIKAGDLSPDAERYFSRSLVDPEGFKWQGEIRATSGADLPQFGRLANWLGNVGLPSLGETAVSAKLEFEEIHEPLPPFHAGRVSIVTEADCRMLPNSVVDLKCAYQDYFIAAVGLGCILNDYQTAVTRVMEGTARQSRRDPAYLTKAGSWFNLEIDDCAARRLSELRERNLPHCDSNADFNSTPFVPSNGYGAFRITS